MVDPDRLRESLKAHGLERLTDSALELAAWSERNGFTSEELVAAAIGICAYEWSVSEAEAAERLLDKLDASDPAWRTLWRFLGPRLEVTSCRRQFPRLVQ